MRGRCNSYNCMSCRSVVYADSPKQSQLWRSILLQMHTNYRSQVYFHAFLEVSRTQVAGTPLNFWGLTYEQILQPIRGQHCCLLHIDDSWLAINLEKARDWQGCRSTAAPREGRQAALYQTIQAFTVWGARKFFMRSIPRKIKTSYKSASALHTQNHSMQPKIICCKFYRFGFTTCKSFTPSTFLPSQQQSLFSPNQKREKSPILAETAQLTWEGNNNPWKSDTTAACSALTASLPYATGARDTSLLTTISERHCGAKGCLCCCKHPDAYCLVIFVLYWCVGVHVLR